MIKNYTDKTLTGRVGYLGILFFCSISDRIYPFYPKIFIHSNPNSYKTDPHFIFWFGWIGFGRSRFFCSRL